MKCEMENQENMDAEKASETDFAPDAGISDGRADTERTVAVTAFENVNDKTNEGMAYIGKNIFTVQFHPEACPGPQDSGYLFDRFMKMMGGTK